MASKTGLTKIRSDFLISVLGRLNSVAANLKGSDSFHEEKKFFFKRLGFSSNLDWGSYLVSAAKTVPKKIRASLAFFYDVFFFWGFTLFV